MSNIGTDAWLEGARIGAEGGSLAETPHAPNSPEGRAWTIGFAQGAMRRRDESGEMMRDTIAAKEDARADFLAAGYGRADPCEGVRWAARPLPPRRLTAEEILEPSPPPWWTRDAEPLGFTITAPGVVSFVSCSWESTRSRPQRVKLDPPERPLLARLRAAGHTRAVMGLENKARRSEAARASLERLHPRRRK